MNTIKFKELYLEYQNTNKEVTYKQFVNNSLRNKEFVNVVDENDNIIGSECRIKCIELGKNYRSARIFVFKDETETEILLCKRSIYLPSQSEEYCLPGGAVNCNESYEDAAIREFFEEMYNTQTKKDIKLIPLFKLFNRNKIFKTYDSGPFNPDENEVGDYIFVNFQDLLDGKVENITKGTQMYIEEYKKLFTSN